MGQKVLDAYAKSQKESAVSSTEAIVRLRAGIKAYEYEQRVILRLLRKHGELSDTDFDRIFSEYKTIIENGNKKLVPRKPKLRFMPMTGDTFILGSLYQGEWAKWLDLTQKMVALQLISTEEKDGHIYYKAI